LVTFCLGTASKTR